MQVVGRSVKDILTILTCLVLTPVLMAIVEQGFSTIKHMKMKIRNKMNDGFFTDCLTLNIEWKLSMYLDLNSIIDVFNAVKYRWGTIVISNVILLFFLLYINLFVH